MKDMICPHPNATHRFTKCRGETDSQGISAGWADVYGSGVACQYIVLTGTIPVHDQTPEHNVDVPDGKHILEVETNPIHEEGSFKGKRYFEEDSYEDNIVKVRVKIRGNNVNPIH